ncbi:MAG: tetratricopeptide repeat protein [Methyloligella sp. ZOD6]
MSDGDLFREVDQAVRHERYRLLWERYGYYIIGVAALIVLVVAGYRGWVYWQEKQAQEAGTEFVSAMQLAQAENSEEAEKAFQDIAKNAPQGYETLARFQLAAADADAGKTKEAVAKYDAIAEDGSVDPILRGNATIQAATLRLPEADYAEMERRLKHLIDENSPWRYSAHDLLGLSAYRLGDLETAQNHFNTLLADSGTPANLRERTTVMLAVISGTKSSGEQPAPAEAPAPQKTETPSGAAGSTNETPAADEGAAAEESSSGPGEDAAPAEQSAPSTETAPPATEEEPVADDAPSAENSAPDEDSSASDAAPSEDEETPSPAGTN